MGPVQLVVCIGVLLQFGVQFSSAINADFNVIYNGTVSSAATMEYTFTHNVSKAEAVRIHFYSPNAETDFPILLVVKRPRSVLSWTVPYIAPNQDTYHYVSHTLCQDDFVTNGTLADMEEINVVISTSSIANLSFSLNASFVSGYDLKLNQSVTFHSDPATPQYYEYEFPEGVDMVLVTAKSDDDICAYFSVQHSKCPVYDSVSTVRYNEGIFQTMDTQAAITVTRDRFHDSAKFVVILVVHPDDEMCDNNYKPLNPLKANHHQTESSRTKTVTIRVERTLEMWMCLISSRRYSHFISFHFFMSFVEADGGNEQGEVPFASRESRTSSYGTAGPSRRLDNIVSNGSSPPTDTTPGSVRRRGEDGGSTDSEDEDIDMLDDIESTKEVYRTKMELFVSDLSRKKPNSLEKKYNRYAWNLFTVSVFYALPVVQLVITYQVVTKTTGNQDSCYYNFMCAKPYGWFSAFNNVFSNTGYVFLGFLFLLLVWRRDYIHKKRVEMGYINETVNGIPKHYGLLYALGYALVMEGVMSGCYHVCPNRANYQFDTAYMYMIACLGMLKMYQQRHPDINANSYISFALFALILFIGFLGLIFSSLYFYILFFIVHMTTCLGLSAQIYYMGTVKLDWGIFKRSFIICKSDIFTCAKPVYKTRLALLSVGLVVNSALSILGLVTQPLDFASFLLAIMIVNMLLYLAFYFIMKLICREKILLVVILFILLTLFLWSSALYFFQLKETAWQYSAARSRARNQPCVILGFFDRHDVWHFLSAASLFVSFVSVLFLDDDLEDQPRTKIRVF
ncbi:SID1 transmembrane family member 1-like [Diadema antillarum]|uniref:SID1 transmembrane family member 1-like n=1 Tax=Diadema antillarum TaxID=105358 RepID=UPI003A8822F2